MGTKGASMDTFPVAASHGSINEVNAVQPHPLSRSSPLWHMGRRPRPLLSGWLILYRGGWGLGGWVRGQKKCVYTELQTTDLGQTQHNHAARECQMSCAMARQLGRLPLLRNVSLRMGWASGGGNYSTAFSNMMLRLQSTEHTDPHLCGTTERGRRPPAVGSN